MAAIHYAGALTIYRGRRVTVIDAGHAVCCSGTLAAREIYENENFTYVIKDVTCKRCLKQIEAAVVGEEARRPINIGTHVSHCCKRHGCKYGDDRFNRCPVVLGTHKQEFPCETCDETELAVVIRVERRNGPHGTQHRSGPKEVKVFYGRDANKRAEKYVTDNGGGASDTHEFYVVKDLEMEHGESW